MPAVSVSAATSTLIVAVDPLRTLVLINNTSTTANLHINFGAAATINEAFIPPSSNLTLSGDSRCKAAINGLSSSGTITAKYTKFSATT